LEPAVSGGPGRPPGLPKTGGRQKGAPNKSTVALAEKLAALGFDPVELLVAIAVDAKTPIDLQVRICSDLLSYLFPKRRPVDEPEPTLKQIKVATVIEAPRTSADSERAL
jgi:hypothetical protein